MLPGAPTPPGSLSPRCREAQSPSWPLGDCSHLPGPQTEAHRWGLGPPRCLHVFPLRPPPTRSPLKSRTKTSKSAQVALPGAQPWPFQAESGPCPPPGAGALQDPLDQGLDHCLKASGARGGFWGLKREVRPPGREGAPQGQAEWDPGPRPPSLGPAVGGGGGAASRSGLGIRWGG